MMNRRSLLTSIGLFFASLVLVVSCNQSTTPETSETPEADPTDTTETAAAPEGEPIKLGYSSWAGWWPWAIAEEEGLFEANGANVELVWFDGYLASMEALAAGQLDANSQTLNDTISFAADAANGMVAVLVNDNSAGNDKIVVSEEIESIEDLAGKEVALEEGVVGDFLLSLALEDAGLSRDDVNIRNLETGAAASAFAAGQTDAFAGWVPFWETALSREGSKELISSAEFPGAIPDLLVVSQTLIDERPEQVQAIVNTWFDILTFMEENQERAYDIMANRANVSPEEFELYLEGTRFFTIEDNLEAFSNGGDEMKYMPYAAERMAEFMVSVGFIPEAPDLDAIFDDTFVQTYAEEQGL